jgi:hypothetical protein
MFNFSANNLIFISKSQYDKYNVLIMKDRHTNRCYKIYDFTKTFCFEPLKPYCIFGKVNSSDKIYLVLENAKEDKKNT